VLSTVFGIAAFYKNGYFPSRPIFPLSTAMLIPSEHIQKALFISNRQFKRLFGVKRQTFNQMLEILQAAFDTQHQRGGEPPTKLRVEDRLLLTLQYWRTYITMEHLAYGGRYCRFTAVTIVPSPSGKGLG
jgi:hypothetical protein